MKIINIIIRTLLGLIYLISGVFFFIGGDMPELYGKMKIIMDAFIETGYFLPFLKIIEALCGLAFVVNRFVKLASIVILPVTIHILLFGFFVDTNILPVALFLLVANQFLIYNNLSAYKEVLKIK